MLSSFLLRHTGAVAVVSVIAILASASSELACGKGGCVDIDPATYDRSCTIDGDCATIAVGNLCNGACLCGTSGAINVSGLPKYNAAIAGITPGECECGFAGAPTCVAHHCVLCGGAEGCPVYDGGTSSEAGEAGSD